MVKSFAFALVLLLAACGTDDLRQTDAGVDLSPRSDSGSAANNDPANSDPANSDPANSGGGPVDMGTTELDAGTEPDPDLGTNEPDAAADMAGTPDMADMSADAGAAPCDQVGFAPTSSEVGSIGTEYLGYLALEGMQTDPTSRALDFGIYTEFGGVIGPQNFVFTGENYADCGVCLQTLLCTAGGGCTRTFLAESGSVEINQIGTVDGAAFEATFTDVELIEVTIDSNTLQSTPVAGGERWCIDTLTTTGTTVAN